MKFVINKSYGCFSVSNKVVKVLGLKSRYDDIDRRDERLIALVEKDAEAASGNVANLVVVNIPDTATDWDIDEYDGLETLIYVDGGKLHRI